MEEEFASVIKDVLAVVARIEHRTQSTLLLESLYHTVQYVVGIADGIVIGIDKVSAILHLGIAVGVRLEVSHLPRVTLHIVEVGTLGVEHDEEFLVFLAQYLVEDREQFGIIDVAILVCLHLEGLTSVSLGESLVAISSLDECPLVGLLA